MLAYTESGSGTPIVLLHAFPLSQAMWEAQLEHLGSYGRVIAVDLPGFGSSPRQTEPSMPGMAQAVAELLDHLAVEEQISLAGLSMGGYVAFEFVRQFPERVRALGLWSTRAGADTPAQRDKRIQLADIIRNHGLETLPQIIMPKLLGDTTRSTRPSVVELTTNLILANQPDGVADALLAMASRRDSTNMLSSITCPTFILAGEEDALIPLEETQAMQQAIPHARLEIIAQADHLISLEQPEAFHSACVQFLHEV